MKTLPSQERALKKRASLITAAISEFSKSSFEVATAKSIALAAEVSTGTFYQYFENKTDILCVIAQNRYEVLHERVGMFELNAVDELAANGVEAAFKEVLMFVYDFHNNAPALHQVLEQRRALDPELKAIMNQGEAVLRRRLFMFVKTFDIDNSQTVADNLFAMGEGIVHRLVFDELSSDPDLAINIGSKMLASYFINVNRQEA